MHHFLFLFWFNICLEDCSSIVASTFCDTHLIRSRADEPEPLPMQIEKWRPQESVWDTTIEHKLINPVDLTPIPSADSQSMSGLLRPFILPPAEPSSSTSSTDEMDFMAVLQDAEKELEKFLSTARRLDGSDPAYF
jgi:hypothetical protein